MEDASRIAVLETKTDAQTARLVRIEEKLDSALERLTRHDEQIAMHNRVGGTLAAAFVAFVGAALKNWFHV